MPALAENLARVRARMEAAARRAGRDPVEVSLVAVTKGCGASVVRALHALGLRDFGENRVQEALPKMGLGLPAVRWHLIGHLQENKINKALPHVAMIQSIDSLRLARAVHERAARIPRRVPVLLEVRTSPETTKHGVPLADAEACWSALQELDALEPRGLMTLAPIGPAADVRRAFLDLRAVFDRLRAHPVPPRELSMGMSDDFEIAIEAGATMVRIGRALTGAPAGRQEEDACA